MPFPLISKIAGVIVGTGIVVGLATSVPKTPTPPASTWPPTDPRVLYQLQRDQEMLQLQREQTDHLRALRNLEDQRAIMSIGR